MPTRGPARTNLVCAAERDLSSAVLDKERVVNPALSIEPRLNVGPRSASPP